MIVNVLMFYFNEQQHKQDTTFCSLICAENLLELDPASMLLEFTHVVMSIKKAYKYLNKVTFNCIL